VVFHLPIASNEVRFHEHPKTLVHDVMKLAQVTLHLRKFIHDG
jgi:hypothetical protein